MRGRLSSRTKKQVTNSGGVWYTKYYKLVKTWPGRSDCMACPGFYPEVFDYEF